MTYLLDTNVCIAFLRGKSHPVLDRFRSHRSSDLSVCATVRSELIFGALRSRDPERELAIVHRFLAPLKSHVFDDPISEAAAKIRAELASAGNSIGP